MCTNDTYEYSDDGDKGNLMPFYSEEAVEVMYKKFNDISHYIKPDGTIAYPIADDIFNMVVNTITK